MSNIKGAHRSTKSIMQKAFITTFVYLSIGWPLMLSYNVFSFIKLPVTLYPALMSKVQFLDCMVERKIQNVRYGKNI